MNLCTRCGRGLKRPSQSGYGPVCERAVLGLKQRRKAAPVQARDESTPDLFAEDLNYALRVDALLGSISLEMPR